MLFKIIKCHHLQVGKHDIGTKYTMISNNQEIELEKVKNEKDLGVIIDQNLTFRDHINSKVNIANRNLGIIFRTDQGYPSVLQHIVSVESSSLLLHSYLT